MSITKQTVRALIDEDSADIRDVTLAGVQLTEEAWGCPMSFVLSVDSSTGDSPTLTVVLYLQGEAAYVELDDCFPLSETPKAAVSMDLIVAVMEETYPREDALDHLLSFGLASAAKLVVMATDEGILFTLGIGEFRTEAVVDPDYVRPFLSPRASAGSRPLREQQRASIRLM